VDRDPLARKLLEGERRAAELRQRGSTLGTAAERLQALGLTDFLDVDSSADVSASTDSIPASSVSVSQSLPLPLAAGGPLPRQLSRVPGTAAAAALGEAAAARRDVRGVGLTFSIAEEEEEIESEDEEGSLSAAVGMYPRTGRAAGFGGAGGGVLPAAAAARASGRRDGAVFRLRQYGARRRKLLQQVSGSRAGG
jgi:hypothetical protein